MKTEPHKTSESIRTVFCVSASLFFSPFALLHVFNQLCFPTFGLKVCTISKRAAPWSSFDNVWYELVGTGDLENIKNKLERCLINIINLGP